MRGNNDYTTGNLLDCEYFSKYYKLIAIDLRKQIQIESHDLKQKINFIGRLDEDNATMVFIIEKRVKPTFGFSQNVVTVVWFGLINAIYTMETQNVKSTKQLCQKIFKICNKKVVCH